MNIKLSEGGGIVIRCASIVGVLAVMLTPVPGLLVAGPVIDDSKTPFFIDAGFGVANCQICDE